MPAGRGLAQLSTAAGRAAKAIVEKLLSHGDEVTVCTTKPDKYDRYLADVFVRPGRGQGSAGQAESDYASPITSHPEGFVFLNNALLTGGYAVPYDGGEKNN